MHQVERALFDIRRGLPVLLRDGDDTRLVHPLEDLDAAGLAALAERPDAPHLVLSRHRLARLGHRIDADGARLALTPALCRDIRRLNALAFGLEHVDALPELHPAGQADRAALALMRRALLIPAALTTRVSDDERPDVEARLASGELLAVEAGEASRLFDTTRGMLRRISEARIPLAEAAESHFILFREPDGLREHVAIVIGEAEQWPAAVPLRLHSACLTGDLFASLRCDCGEQLRNAVAEIGALGGGVLLYLAQEGRGIGLANKLRAYTLQDAGLDTVDADQALGFGEDERQYGVAVDMLAALGIRRVQLLTNNPVKIAALTDGGIEVTERQAVYGRLTEHNARYLHAKAHRAGHLLDEVLGGHRESGQA